MTWCRRQATGTIVFFTLNAIEHIMPLDKPLVRIQCFSLTAIHELHDPFYLQDEGGRAAVMVYICYVAHGYA